MAKFLFKSSRCQWVKFCSRVEFSWVTDIPVMMSQCRCTRSLTIKHCKSWCNQHWLVHDPVANFLYTVKCYQMHSQQNHPLKICTTTYLLTFFYNVGRWVLSSLFKICFWSSNWWTVIISLENSLALNRWQDIVKRPGGRLNIKMPSYQYRDSHVKDKTVSPTVLSLTWESKYMPGKDGLYIETGPSPQKQSCPTIYVHE